MLPKNGLVHVECSIMINVVALSTEAELGGLSENQHKVTSIRTALA